MNILQYTMVLLCLLYLKKNNPLDLLLSEDSCKEREFETER